MDAVNGILFLFAAVAMQFFLLRQTAGLHDSSSSYFFIFSTIHHDIS
jgi:hypothetical protein